MTTHVSGYKREVYFIAALVQTISELSADAVRAINRPEQILELLKADYKVTNRPIDLISIIDLLSTLDLVVVDEDVYAGTFITLQKTAFLNQVKSLAESDPDTPIAVVLRAKRPWIETVFANEVFWEDISDDEVGHESVQVPAADRIVTLLHNSAERNSIETVLSGLADSIQTNNEIAVILGDDRERVAAEVNAISAGIKSEKIRVSFLRETVIKTLKEIANKLFEKALKLGIDKLIVLFEHVISSYS